MKMKLIRRFQVGAAVRHIHLEDRALSMCTKQMTTPHNSDKDAEAGSVEEVLELRCGQATLPDRLALVGVSRPAAAGLTPHS
jgi:hypothetical protein